MIVFFAFLIYLIAVRWLDLHYELRRTRKALEYAKDELDVISLKYHKTTPSIILIKYAEHAKAKITALEKNERFAYTSKTIEQKEQKNENHH